MKNKKNAQKKLINELKNQLLIQSERLGIRDDYSPLYMEELKLDSVKKIMTEFYMERSNLEYELNMLASNKKELLIKLERLQAYIRKAVGLHEQHLNKFEAIIEKGTGEPEKVRRAVKKLKPARVQAAA
ncbi:MAG: hypothetical protein ABIA67_01000 [Candidatus Margulisiibacteriota bacterium]